METINLKLSSDNGTIKMGNYIISWNLNGKSFGNNIFQVFIESTLELENVIQIVVAPVVNYLAKDVQVISKCIEFTSINKVTQLIRTSSRRLMIGIKLVKPRLTKFENTFINDLQSLQTEEETKDVTFVIGSEEFKAHKIILTARSSVFKKTFETNMLEKSTNKVKITDASIDAFKLFLVFIYTNQFEPGDFAEELLYLGDKYDVQDLRVMAANYLLETITSENALQTFVALERFHMTHLKRVALKFIALNRDKAYTTEKKDDFQSSHPNLSEAIELAIFLLTDK